MNTTLINAIGYFAIVINLYSMSSKSEYKLRVVSVFANFTFIVYGVLINAFPIIIGCFIAIFLHLNRLKDLK